MGCDTPGHPGPPSFEARSQRLAQATGRGHIGIICYHKRRLAPASKMLDPGLSRGSLYQRESRDQLRCYLHHSAVMPRSTVLSSCCVRRAPGGETCSTDQTDTSVMRGHGLARIMFISYYRSIPTRYSRYWVPHKRTDAPGIPPCVPSACATPISNHQGRDVRKEKRSVSSAGPYLSTSNQLHRAFEVGRRRIRRYIITCPTRLPC